MKTKELRQMNKEELEKRLEQLRRELIKYNSQISTSTPPENPGNVKKAKKTIAKVITILKTKEQEVQNKKSNE